MTGEIVPTQAVQRCWWLYLLSCEDGRTYAGIATAVEKRFRAHQRGKGAKFTRSNPPTAILGMRAFATRSEALQAEHALKQLSREQKLAWAVQYAPVIEQTSIQSFGFHTGQHKLPKSSTA